MSILKWTYVPNKIQIVKIKSSSLESFFENTSRDNTLYVAYRTLVIFPEVDYKLSILL